MKNQTAPKLTREAARLQVQQALSTLSELQNALGNKKFQRRVKKAEKLLAGGLPKASKIKKVKAEPASV